MISQPTCVPYAGGSFVGSATSPSAPILYFHGLYIRRAAVASLQASYNFNAATDVIVGGGSAGGLAAYLHVDWYASQAPRGSKTRGLPDSGVRGMVSPLLLLTSSHSVWVYSFLKMATTLEMASPTMKYACRTCTNLRTRLVGFLLRALLR